MDYVTLISEYISSLRILNTRIKLSRDISSRENRGRRGGEIYQERDRW